MPPRTPRALSTSRPAPRRRPDGSPERSLALINLGTRAVLRQDYAAAIGFYDAAVPPGDSIYSDPMFHAFRADAYAHVGRREEALADARIALRQMNGETFPGVPVNSLAHDPDNVLPRILPILKAASDPGFDKAMRAYLALPARDWISHANRASVLADLGDYEAAAAESAKALAIEPNHPGLLNNVCYMQAKAGRPADGLPYCERAIAAAPDFAGLRDSYATALAGLGRCREAEVQMAEARRLDPVSIEYRRTLACRAG
ncbi:tetratricopeptide repeat protein [Phenylobacterium sp. J367]|uniref:tetratricopeptide repeat protein n=1 Tax=Phenylobacterium sp. J367 TaxID=2898435 RepID=UPI002150D6DA|nr:tetratricopeptide repeat protein [Phenylobacterium sp. J367]MCR5878439.1 tetratricopeptide repeat protein [Phenylobacterium sp. J367]